MFENSGQDISTPFGLGAVGCLIGYGGSSVTTGVDRPAQGQQSPRVTYVTSRWGAPTQTFVRREAETLDRLGFDVQALSLKRALPTATQVPVKYWSPLKGVARFGMVLLRHPITVLRVMATIICWSAPRNIIPRAAAAVIGVAHAHSVERTGSIMHTHFGWVAVTAAWAAHRLTGSPYTVVLHAFEIHTEGKNDRFTRLPLSEATQIFAISEFDSTLIRDRWGLTADVLRMGVPDEWIVERAGQGERDPNLIVSVGSLVPKKGHDTLINALATLPREWHLTIIGEGADRVRLESMAADLGVTGRITFAGKLSEADVRQTLDRAWAFVLACRVAKNGDRDGIPVALMEAMARGVPVVTTALGGIPELVRGCGILVADDSAFHLANAISALRDPDAWDAASTAGINKIRDSFTSTTCITPLIETFGRIASTPDRMN